MPSASEAGVTVQLVVERVAWSVWTVAPSFWSITVTVASSPVASPAVPAISGV